MRLETQQVKGLTCQARSLDFTMRATCSLWKICRRFSSFIDQFLEMQCEKEVEIIRKQVKKPMQ